MIHTARARGLVVAMTSLAVSLSLVGVVTPTAVTPAQAVTTTVTNTAHLDFLLDTVTPTAVAGHTTYRLASEPALTVPWTYADARPGGTFERVGGGTLDPTTGDYTQGAYNADDITRAAVVYIRHWQQFRDRASKDKAYELLRAAAYLQTTTGPDRGNVVLWMQSDGELNPSAEPVELPDPSDSDASYWLARSIWAFGEGYAAFAKTDPDFARFLQTRLRLGVGAVERQSLDQYGHYTVSDGKRVPAWLIVNGADATAEASLGLSAYVEAAPRDRRVEKALGELLEGVAAMGTPTNTWPYGAILPWAKSRAMWHAWSSEMGAGLARGAEALDRPRLLRPAITEAVSFDPTLITAGGPDNAWYPSPVDKTQIAYGADSRVQTLLAVADTARLPGLRDLAAMNASWFFGTNASGEPVYDPTTGVTYDGVAADGTINRNSGAESTIHGLLTMLALDAHPKVRAAAVGTDTAVSRDGLRMVEAEKSTATTGSVVTPTSAWTGESQWSGGAYVQLDRGERAVLDLGPSDQKRRIEPVSWLTVRGSARSKWTVGRQRSTLMHHVGAQGLSEVPGALLPQRLRPLVSARTSSVTVKSVRGAVQLDGVLVRPDVSSAVLSGDAGVTTLLSSIATRRSTVDATVEAGFSRYDDRGRLVASGTVGRSGSVSVEAGGFTVLKSRR